MKKWVNYFLFISVGIAKGAKNGKLLDFIAAEIRAKIRRFRNKKRIEEMCRLFDTTTPSDYVSNASPLQLERLQVFSLSWRGNSRAKAFDSVISSSCRHPGR
jgi:hypothetical protein